MFHNEPVLSSLGPFSHAWFSMQFTLWNPYLTNNVLTMIVFYNQILLSGRNYYLVGMTLIYLEVRSSAPI